MHWAAKSPVGKDVIRSFYKTRKQEPLDLTTRCNMGKSPLQWAVQEGNAQTIATMFECGNIQRKNQDVDGNSALHLAVLRADLEVFNALLDGRFKQGQPDLSLLKVQNKQGFTPVDLAVMSESAELREQLLARFKIDLNWKDQNELSALDRALERQDTVLVKQLYRLGVGRSACSDPKRLDELLSFKASKRRPSEHASPKEALHNLLKKDKTGVRGVDHLNTPITAAKAKRLIGQASRLGWLGPEQRDRKSVV